MMEALNLSDAVMLELMCLDLSLLPAVRAKGLFGRLDEGQFARIFINAYLAAENTELVAELQKRGWNFMDAVILDCPADSRTNGCRPRRISLCRVSFKVNFVSRRHFLS